METKNNARTITLKTPNAPATKAQLFMLHILTKQDTRVGEWTKLTMAEASNAIELLKAKQAKHAPAPKPAPKPEPAPEPAVVPSR